MKSSKTPKNKTLYSSKTNVDISNLVDKNEKKNNKNKKKEISEDLSLNDSDIDDSENEDSEFLYESEDEINNIKRGINKKNKTIGENDEIDEIEELDELDENEEIEEVEEVDDNNNIDKNDDMTISSQDNYENDDKIETDYIENEEMLKTKCYSKYAGDEEDIDVDELFGDDDFNLIKNIKLSKPVLTKYEFVRLLTDRTKQLLQGAKPMLKNTNGLTPKEIAHTELKKKIIPLIIIRPMPNSEPERWKISELELPEYLFII